MQLVAELPLVPRICTLSCETDKQRMGKYKKHL